MTRQQGFKQLIFYLVGVLFYVVDLGFTQMEQGAQLLLCSLNKLAQGPLLENSLGGFDNFLEPLPVAFQSADISI